MSTVGQMLAESVMHRDEEIDDLYARIEKAADILRGHFFQRRYVGTVPQAVVQEALAVLEGEP